MTGGKYKGRDIKAKVLAGLQADNLDEALKEVSQLPGRQVVNALFSFLLSGNDQVRWRAITAMGLVVANLADEDMEAARVVMRRLMWMLNDESGGIGWGAPEAMGEIIAAHEGLAKEYAPVLISYVWEEGNFLEYEPLQCGAVWGVGRVAQVRPELVRDAIPYLISQLESSDAALRGLTAWTLGLLHAEEAKPQLEALVGDDGKVLLCLDGSLVGRTVGDLAKEALAGIDKRKHLER